MNLLARKASKKPNLLELSDPDKVQIMKKAKEQLKEAVIEAKLWRSLAEAEDLQVDSTLLACEKLQIGGFLPEKTM